MDQNPQLKVLEGTLKGEQFEVTPDGIVIGRGDDCQVRLVEPGVSREHARVFLHNAGVWVQDLGSRNGVYVKDAKITRAKSLSPGTRFKVGEHTFVISLTEMEKEAGTPPPLVGIPERPTNVGNEPTVSEPAPVSPLRGIRLWAVIGGVLALAAIAAKLLAG
jgi:pSer/pThr/pTyr-binding forkhead associated (FHA) protein